MASAKISAAGLVGIHAATLYDWQRRFPEFSEGLEKADATCERVCIGAGRNPRN